MRSQSLLSLAVLGAMSCSAKPPEPSDKDVHDALKGLRAVASVSGDLQWPFLLAWCSEIPSCAQGCARELSAYRHQLDAPILMRACSGVDDYVGSAKGAAAGARVDTFLRNRMHDFCARVRIKLTASEQQDLDALQAKLKL
jgi:hypothetical protein